MFKTFEDVLSYLRKNYVEDSFKDKDITFVNKKQSYEIKIIYMPSYHSIQIYVFEDNVWNLQTIGIFDVINCKDYNLIESTIKYLGRELKEYLKTIRED